jgi:hypothetical protein
LTLYYVVSNYSLEVMKVFLFRAVLPDEADPPDSHQGQLPLRRAYQDCPQGAGRQQGEFPMD